MTYLALYRQWRPQKFSGILGQEHVSRTLINALGKQKIRHAYLFCGPRGTGKTSTAKVLAKALNCLRPEDSEPCNQCAACQRITSGSSLDVLEIDAASNRGIDEIRELRENVKFSPAEEKFKVYIIDEVHMLTPEAFNALLKTLEEPPARVVFILATTEPQKLPLTIISRCQRFDFRRISDQVIAERLIDVLESEGIAFQQQAVKLIARVAEGGLRDALSLLDQCLAFGDQKLSLEQVTDVIGTVTNEVFAQMMTMMAENNVGGVLKLVDKMIADGREIVQCTRDFLQYCRDLLLLKSGADLNLQAFAAETITEMKEQAEKYSVDSLWRLVEMLKNAELEMRWSQQPRISLELVLIKFVRELKLTEDAAPVKRQEEREEETKIVSVGENKVKTAGNAKENAGAKEETLENWTDVLEKVKKIKVTTFAFLAPAEPSLPEKELLRLTFAAEYKFHKEKMAEQENIKVLEQVLQDVYQKPLKVKIVLTGENESENNAGDNKAENTDMGSDLLQKAIEIFGGNLVEIKED